MQNVVEIAPDSTALRRLREYELWIPGHGMLGSDVQKALNEVMREYLEEKHDACGGDQNKITAFLNSHDELVQECANRIERYQRQASEYRRENGLRPFDWRLEKISTMRGILRAKKGNNVLPVTPEQRQKYWAAKAAEPPSLWRSVLRPKVAKNTLFSCKHGGVEPPFYRRRRGKEPEGLVSVLASVARLYNESGVFRSIQKRSNHSCENHG